MGSAVLSLERACCPMTVLSSSSYIESVAPATAILLTNLATAPSRLRNALASPSELSAADSHERRRTWSAILFRYAVESTTPSVPVSARMASTIPSTVASAAAVAALSVPRMSVFVVQVPIVLFAAA
uniref:Uncharacterized protein n=1 Tax=uncultured marine virus TaxID=186617 RepID=A0A0F7L5A9_9VIRU|nr:hypothetical protein [uncultured marine virus]